MLPSGRGAAMLQYLKNREEEDAAAAAAAAPAAAGATSQRRTGEHETIGGGPVSSSSGVAVARPTGRGRSRLLLLDPTQDEPGPLSRSGSGSGLLPTPGSGPGLLPTPGSGPGLLPTPRSGPGLLPFPGSGQGHLPTQGAGFVPTPRSGLLPDPSQRSGFQPSREPEIPPPKPQGRGALLAGFQAESQQMREPVREMQPPPPSQTKKEMPRGMTDLQTAVSDMSLEDDLPPVVKKGVSGRGIDVVCNYVYLHRKQGYGVYEYTVSFNPPEDGRGARVRMLVQHLEEMGGTKQFDGWKLLLPVKLPDKESRFKCTHPDTGQNVTMIVSYKKTSPVRECADLYNMLFRRIMGYLGLKSMGRKFFDPNGAVSVPQHRLEIWPGYVTQVSQFEGGLLLCCDASHRVMRCDSALDLLRDLARRNESTMKEDALKNLMGAVVLTRYNNKTYRIDDIDWNQSPRSSFNDTSGKSVCYLDYYKQHYDIEIRDTRQPLLLSRVKRKLLSKGTDERLVCLIPELCNITGLTDSMRADFRVMKDLTQKLQLTPQQRYEGFLKFLQNVTECPKSRELLGRWKVRIDEAPVKLQARVVDTETIKFNGEGAFIKLPPGNANWSVNHRLLVTVNLSDWVILFAQQDSHIASDFARTLQFCAKQYGMQVQQPKMVKVPDNRNESLMASLRQCVHPNLELAVVFFSSLRSDKYAMVKKICCVEKPIPSQVIQSKTLSRPEKAKQIIKKIALQINCKLGGSLWSVSIPYTKLMVCGIDTYHGPAGKGQSVLGFVAALDPLQTTWFSRVDFSGSAKSQELGNKLMVFMSSAIASYYDQNGFPPERIVLFRDGVGDGQLNMTAEFEVPQMLQAFQSVHADYKPKFTVVICQKRIMTRILAMNNGGGRVNLRNPEPGTVLDHTVTRYKWYDFFLVSQSSNRGTVSPSHYIVVYDDGDTKPDHVQRLAYKMTHMYYNWTGTVSVPAPCLYAHRLAQLAGEHLHKEPHNKLSNKLFFL